MPTLIIIVVSITVWANFGLVRIMQMNDYFHQKTNLSVQIDLVIYGQNGKIRIAKNLDRIYKNEKFQIIIRANSDSRLIMMNKSLSDCKTLANFFINLNRNYYLPNAKEFYALDGSNKIEEFFFIIFNNSYEHSDFALNPTLSCESKWEFITNQFNELFSIKSRPVPPILQLSGNIRTSELSEKLDGNNVIIKKYLLNVQ